MRAPVIAITPWLRSLPTALGAQTALYTLDPAYAACLAAAGALPTIVTHAGDAAAALAGADGLVLSGGSDVHPGSYGSAHDVTEADVSAAVDRWELELLAEARRRRLPTLGICRGMQLLAVAHGGTLVQHLDDESHPGMGVLRPEETLARRHHVDLVASSTLAAILGTDRIHVNTIHHHGVDDPGSLRVSATGPSGVVEAVESEEWPALGVQWHPEKMHEPGQRRLFEYLTDQAR